MLVIRPLGAQLLRVPHDLLYLSPLTAAADQPARGGVPVLFPQFADLGPLVKHGMARRLVWQCMAEQQASATWQLNIEPTPAWPHRAQLTLHTQWQANELAQTLTVVNTGDTPFHWTGGLHPYWAVDDLLACEMQGLGGEPLQFGEQGYEQAHAIDGPVRLAQPGAASLQLDAQGASHWMVWNPGASGARQLADMPPDDWQRFVCIEPVRLQGEPLAPQQAQAIGFKAILI